MDTSLGAMPQSVIPNRRTPRHPASDLPHVPSAQNNEKSRTVLQRASLLQGDKSSRRGETAAHLELKRLALIWARENGYPITAFEVSLPQCRYRADVAAYRPQRNGTLGHTVVFECKQSAPDLRHDDRRAQEMLNRLELVYRRRQILEKHLRIHYPTLRTGDTLFPEWDTHDFGAIRHRGYERVTREVIALQNQLRDGRKFEKLARYACANLFYLVLPDQLLREPEAPLGWGLLLEKGGALILKRKPIWHESSEACRLRILQKIAGTGTRQLIRQLENLDRSPANAWLRVSIGRNADSS